jgi:predicted ATPase
MSSPPSSPPTSAPFVGRTRELDRLGGFLDKAMAGAGRSCFVTGEPGAGKSTLIAEFGRRARERYPDLVLAAGDCNPQTGTDDAYLPFREIMTRLTTGVASGDGAAETAANESRLLSTAARLVVDYGPDLIDLLVPGGAVMTRLGGEVAARLRKRRSANPAAGPGTQGHLGQAQLMEQYTNVVRAVAESHPLLLVVDDLHWADEASISLLFHLVRRIGDRRVLILGAFRANEITAGRGEGRHPLEAPLNEIRRYAGDVEVDLPAGQAESGRQFIDQLLDAEANELDQSFRDDLFRRTGGHALFTVELLHHLREHGLLARNASGAWALTGDLAWEGLPARVEGVIGERAARLAREENELLAAASVLGESFDAEVLAEMTGNAPGTWPAA